ncbi:MAG: hypothetical protein LBK99_26440 [Opitutaceae bacterium]|jgi:hypothetical protein|nr:hypothetical protein [Opitutaceae bacterium]
MLRKNQRRGFACEAREDLERVTQISLGMNMKQSTNALEVSDLIVVWPK